MINAYDFVLMALDAMDEGVQGKTLLQKRIYFLGFLTGHLGDLGYGPHYYGPYSADVADAVSQLKSLGFVSESRLGMGVADSWGFEVSRYDYALTDDGKTIAKLKAKQYSEVALAISKAWEKIKQTGNLNKDYMKLSVAAKICHIVCSREEPVTNQELSELANGFGWRIVPEDAKEATAFLSDLKLIELIQVPS